MAKSKAKKMREHGVRQGKLDPTMKRGSWNGVNPIEKKTLTKKQILDKLERKERYTDARQTFV